MYSLNLYKHTFDQNSAHKDKAAYLARWNSEPVVRRLHREAGGRPLFLLHDGPPYANGNLHLGHAVNKTLKDAVVKFKRLQGYFAPYVPGFDCHGLPVELEVEKRGHPKTDPVSFVSACRAYAQTQVALQTAQFQSFGVLADWERPYLTMEPSFESEAAHLFTTLPGAVKRLRPVHWCPACASSLAEAEVEYKPRTSDSLTLRFPVVGEDGVHLLVWTTTPYTLPANKAVAFNPNLSYVAVPDDQGRRLVRLRQSGDEALPDYELTDKQALSPYTRLNVPLLPADYVSRSGTGLVHLAPAFGADDFRVGEAHGLPVEQYLDEHGKFVCAGMAGMSLQEARDHVLARVVEFTHSLSSTEHEYPHCWRHKKPVFFRSSQEWFLELGETGAQALAALDAVQFVPQSGKERLSAMLRTRTSWCVSRRRLWGTPLVDPQNAEDLALAQRVAAEGVEAWQSEGPRPTLDVWFDSGVTHELVMRKRFGRTADVYLEGSDQHRGWFQSSLLTSVAATGAAPFKHVLTHGFVVDEHGQKYSKSSKNYVPLDKLLEQMSPDVLRLWVLQQDYTRELKFSNQSLGLTKERYRKLRNTMRFCLQNLPDFDWAPVALPKALDQAQVALLHRLCSEVVSASEQFDFAAAVAALVRFSETVSSDYFSVVKDSLYCDRADAPRRRQVQYVLSLVLRTLVCLLSPVLPFTTEEAYQHFREAAAMGAESAALLTLDDAALPSLEDADSLLSEYHAALALKGQMNKFVDSNRVGSLKGAAQVEASVPASSSGRLLELLEVLNCAAVVTDASADSASFQQTSRLACPCCRRHVLPPLLPAPVLCARCEEVQEPATATV